MFFRNANGFGRTAPLLAAHFGKRDLAALSIRQRQFPARVRADLQRSLDSFFAPNNGVVVHRFSGLRQEIAYQAVGFAELVTAGWVNSPVTAPPEYEDVDVGEAEPVRCVKVGLWLAEQTSPAAGGSQAAPVRYAVLLSPVSLCGMAPTHVRVQVATAGDDAGAAVAEHLFRAIERGVHDARSYRGKVLSLESESGYGGQSTGIKVHKLRAVPREHVILPRRTLDLLDRNVIRFAAHRDRLAAAGQGTRKGLLFYGPPGTGKSHTIHYLAAALPGHTTLLITAEQVALLGEYMALARLLQPSVVVIEDVDLIARDRAHLHGPFEESLLNKLLNEMDGLREAADVLFLLTTNRPEALEAALASRPGRVDQAIEFPLPDADGRGRLIRLYGDRAGLTDDLVRHAVARTAGTSAAFIKELIRRSVQFRVERDPAAAELTSADVDAALDEMLFAGGSLNVKLLGGQVESPAGAGEACPVA